MLGFSSAAVALLDVSGMLPPQPLRNATSLGLSDDAWPAAGVPLRIVVLGTSPTSGCNACHLTLPNATRDARCVRGAKHCDPHVGWGGQLRERLAAWLPVGVPVEVTVHGKSAVSASYHAKCTSTRVPAGPGVIVLVEVATNLWGGPTVAKGLVAAIRRASPRAAITFVAWVPSSGFKLAAAGQPRPAELYEAGPVAQLADMLRGRRRGFRAELTRGFLTKMRRHLLSRGGPFPLSKLVASSLYQLLHDGKSGSQLVARSHRSLFRSRSKSLISGTSSRRPVERTPGP